MRQVAQWPGSWTGISCFGSRTPYPDDSCAAGRDRFGTTEELDAPTDSLISFVRSVAW
jgi:hypothetical protein